MSETATFRLDVNGEERVVEGAWVGESLLYVLRERLGLPGAKNACEQGECGSCSVLLDGTLVCACLVLGASAAERKVVTVEGLPDDDGQLTDVQSAFLDEGAVQCGFCTPGLIVTVHDLLERNAAPSDLELREAISGNLCRCTGYGRILAAAQSVVAQRSTSGRSQRETPA
jgi:carbon-monoxide dehydrogenase small subunit